MTSAVDTVGTAPTATSQRRPHLTAVPDCEPPFDRCDRPPAVPARRQASQTGVPRRPTVAPDPDAAGREVAAWPEPDGRRPLRTPTKGLPPAGDAARAVARGLIEVLCGIRPVRQLGSVCAPRVQADLAGRVLRDGIVPRLISVRTGEPADGVAEVAAVYRRGPRAVAMAFRLQGVDGRWQITALQIG